MHSYYYQASFERKNDCDHLRTNEASSLYSIYSAGVAVECIIRAYITRNKKQFDGKHDLVKLIKESELYYLLTEKEKVKLTEALTEVTKIWNNNLRYRSLNEMKKIIFYSKYTNSRAKYFNKFLKREMINYFNSTNYIIELAKSKWT